MPAFAVNSNIFSGAEIEQAVISVIFEARARNAILSSTDVLYELGRIRPLSVVMAERMDALRAWAHDRAVLADEKES